MDNLLHAKFDSDEEDDDYVPVEGINIFYRRYSKFNINIDKDSKNKKNTEKDLNSDEEIEKGGIAGLKALKRKKEIDDIWAMMNEQDDYYKKPQ